MTTIGYRDEAPPLFDVCPPTKAFRGDEAQLDARCRARSLSAPAESLTRPYSPSSVREQGR